MRQWAELRLAVERDWLILRPIEELALFGEPGQNYASVTRHANYMSTGPI